MPTIPGPDCIAHEADPIRKQYLQARFAELQRALDTKDQVAGETVVDRMRVQGFKLELIDMLNWLAARKITEVLEREKGEILLGLALRNRRRHRAACQCAFCRGVL